MARDSTLTVEQVRAITDPVERIKTAKAVQDDHQAAVADLAWVRTEAVRELREQRYSVAQIGEMLGVTVPAVYKILGRSPGQEVLERRDALLAELGELPR